MRLTAERLRALVSYDPTTGKFTRLVTTSSRAIAGREAGSPSCGYVCLRVDGHEYLAHRLAWLYMTGEWPMAQIDHRNLNRADNRFENLREASHAENSRNRPAPRDNTSGAKGVTWHKKAGKWMAQIACDGDHHYLGLFLTVEDASAAYAVAADRLHGEFANA